MAAKMSKVSVIKQFFGMKPGQTAVDFLKEYKELSETERTDLAVLAAKEMGVEIQDL